MPASPLAPAWLGYPEDANALRPGLWAAGVDRAGDGRLAIQGIPVDELAATYGTPRTAERTVGLVYDRDIFAAGNSPFTGLLVDEARRRGKVHIVYSIAHSYSQRFLQYRDLSCVIKIVLHAAICAIIPKPANARKMTEIHSV